MDPRSLGEKTTQDLIALVSDYRDKVAALNGRIETLHQEVAALSIERGTLIQQAAAVSAEVERRTRPAPQPRLSDHALLRYIERIGGIDLDGLRERILSPTIVAAIQAGATGVTVDGVRFIVKDNVIVTAVTEERGTRRKSGRESDPHYLKAQLAEYYEDREEEERAA